MRDEVVYRCVNHSCARALPRRVNYCPYCGINQVTALPRPVAPRAGLAQQETVLAEPVTVDVTATASAPTTLHTQATEPQLASAAAAPASASPPPRTPPPNPPHQASTAAAPAAADPARPRPIRLRWIALVLAALWLTWLTQRPTGSQSGRELAARIDRAVAMAAACKANEAQAELIALRDKASTVQLARLQSALDEADVSCRKAGRARAASRAAPRAAVPQSQSVRNLLADGRGALARGDYRAAANKMEVCVTMVDADTSDCSALKARAERLEADMRRCLGRGADWVNDSCQ